MLYACITFVSEISKEEAHGGPGTCKMARTFGKLAVQSAKVPREPILRSEK